MTIEVKLSPKTIALAAAGAAVLGMPLDAALLRPVVVPQTPSGSARRIPAISAATLKCLPAPAAK